MRPFVIHAHYYQPERANPWTGELDPEPSAAPHRDWNERILRECYRPNGAARVYDKDGRVERIVNNYERLSFNFGPTLLSWMQRACSDTYAKVLDGDRRARCATGHGNAIAQAYNHMILPLANDRDRRTQIRWGLAGPVLGSIEWDDRGVRRRSDQLAEAAGLEVDDYKRGRPVLHWDDQQLRYNAPKLETGSKSLNEHRLEEAGADRIQWTACQTSNRRSKPTR